MSLEQAIQENTAAVRELIAALQAGGIVQNAQTSAAVASMPAVKAVKKAQDALAKNEATGENEGAKQATTAADPEPSTAELKPWAEKTLPKFRELQSAKATLANLQQGILAINNLAGRPQAEAVLARFGVQSVSTKPGKTGLSEDQYVDAFGMMLRVLAGTYDPTEAEVTA